ncbi:serine/threonine protein kinase [Aliiglaciecola aliphaticivorans]
MSSQTESLALPPGTILQQYQIESVLGMGGFGIVYKAKHLRLDSDVAIKEYLPQHCASRQGSTVQPVSQQSAEEFNSGIESFLNEAKQLVVFEDHPNIIRCKDFFDLNGTAYLVMNLEHGLELAEILHNYADAGHSLTQEQIISLIVPILDGLSFIHSEGVLHRDIKPTNIFVRKADSRPLLIDFGAAKQNFQQTQKTKHQMHTPGYAPLEQLGSEGDLGAWTDIYAVGVMIWRIVTSNPQPPEAQFRTVRVMQGKVDPAVEELDKFKGAFTQDFIDTTLKAMAINISDRFQTAEEFKTALLQSNPISDKDLGDEIKTIAPGGIVAPTPTPTPTHVEKSKLKPILLWCGAVIICLLVVIGLRYSNVSALFDEQSISETAKINIDEEIEIIYTLMSKAEMYRNEIISNESVIDTLRSLGELDTKTQKNLRILVASNDKNRVSIQDNLQRASARTLALSEQRAIAESDVDLTIENKIASTKVRGNYEKSEFFKDLHNLIVDVSSLTTKTEKQSLILKKLTI